MTTRQTRCIECRRMGRQSSRAAYNPGPRCDEHWREELRKRSKAAHGKRIEKTFEIDSDTYGLIYEFQGGHCFICQKATGKTRRLAIDHDHACDQGHPAENGCRKCIRALLCKRCNKLVAFLDEHALARAIIVLTDPPAQRILAGETSGSPDEEVLV